MFFKAVLDTGWHKRYRPLVALLMVACAFGVRPAHSQFPSPTLSTAVSGTITAPTSGPITTFPVINGTAHDDDSDLSLVGVLIVRRSNGATQDTYAFWTGSAWQDAITLAHGATLTADQIKGLVKDHALQLPTITVSGKDANWTYTSVPTGANLTSGDKGTYFVAAGIVDKQLNFNIAKAGDAPFVTLTVGSTTPPDKTPPTGTLLPTSGIYSLVPAVQVVANDNVALDHALIGLLRRLEGPTTAQYQFWNGTAFVTAVTVSKTQILPAVQIGAIVQSKLALLPRVPLSGKTATFSYTKLPRDKGTYYLAVAIFDKAGNFKLLPGAPGYFNTITVMTPQAFISGRVTKLDGTETVGVGGIPVYLASADDLSSHLTLNTLSSLRHTTTSTTATTEHPAGFYSFGAVAPGNYLVLPVAPGNYFTPFSYRVPVTAATTKVGDRNFQVGGTDTDKPVVTITTPKANSTQTSLTSVVGTVSDTGGSGVLGVVLGLFKLNKIGDKEPVAILNWTSNTFVSSTVGDGSVFKFITTDNTSWSQTLPKLENGNYRVRAFALDKAFNVGAVVSSDFTIGTPTTTPQTLIAADSRGERQKPLSRGVVVAATGIVHLQFLRALDASSASDPKSFSVLVNGQSVAVESAAYHGHSHQVTLSLADGSVKPGDKVTVGWSGLQTAKGAPIADGQITLTAR
ncbi:MAG: hypothetical protein JO316_05030 [Abitibacteriaceae bacterium]|nr:hypothetical protein [Abditibacteriaceae bacterium]